MDRLSLKRQLGKYFFYKRDKWVLTWFIFAYVVVGLWFRIVADHKTAEAAHLSFIGQLENANV